MTVELQMPLPDFRSRQSFATTGEDSAVILYDLAQEQARRSPGRLNRLHQLDIYQSWVHKHLHEIGSM